jgi:hypothetical protein
MAGEQPPAPNLPAPRWRGSGPAGPAGRRPGDPSRGRKLFLRLLLLAALVGAVTALLALFIHPMREPYFTGLPVREYDARLWPPNPLAVQDNKALLRHFEDPRDAYTSQTHDQILKELDNLRTRQGSPVVVYLTALAVATEDGVYVLPGDARPDDRDRWLPLREVLQRLRACPADRKLLILDLSHPLADSRLGVLLDDVAGPVRQEVEKKADPHLLVLCACSTGQVSLTCPEEGLSAFAYYLDQGLSGLADADQNGRVTVKELADFVRRRVDRWARLNRDARQTPALLGSGDDFPLVSVKAGDTAGAPEPAPAPSYPEWLLKAWQERDAAWTNDTLRDHSLALRQLEAVLLRAEQRWQGGVEDERPQRDVGRELGVFRERLKQAGAAPAGPRRSLKLARAAGEVKEKDLAAAAAAVRALLARLTLGPGVKGDERTQALKEEDAARDAFLKKGVKDLPFLPVAAAAFEGLADAPEATQQKVKVVSKLLKEYSGQAPYVETLLLQRLLGLSDDVEYYDWPWPAEQVRLALEAVRRQQEAVAALADVPQALPWVGELFQQAEARRVEGEKALFGGPRTWGGADAPLLAADKAYRKVVSDIDTLRKARDEYTEALTALPGYVPYLVGGAAGEVEGIWDQAVAAACRLGDAWAAPGPKAFAEVAEQRQLLRRHLDRLQRALADRLARPTGPAPGGPAEYLELRALLECPRLPAKQRQACWEAAHALGRRLHEKALEADRAAPPGREELPPPAGDAAAVQRAERRVRCAVGLLRLGGQPGADGLYKRLPPPAARADPAAWRPLADRLRQTWARELPKQLQADAARPLAADRLAHVLPPFDLEDRPAAGAPGAAGSPGAALRREAAAAFWQWLGGEYLKESQRFPANSVYAAFYAESAALYPRVP